LTHQVFISYATEDIDSARLLCRILEAEEGIRCWIALRPALRRDTVLGSPGPFASPALTLPPLAHSPDEQPR
jgi:hypothetical protein